jgi:hypothetical protein
MFTIKNFKTIDASLKHREWFFEIGGHDQAMKVRQVHSANTSSQLVPTIRSVSKWIFVLM